MKVAMFWDSEGVIFTHCVPKSTKVTGETYQDVLRSFFQHCLKNVPEKAAAVLFHHDNAPPHRAARVHQFFHNNFEVVEKPDLATTDFWLFPTLEDTPRGHNEPLKKSLLRPCNRGVSVVKNVCLQGDYVEK
jgi:hypothetical protein